MKYTVNEFISYVEDDLNGLIEEISNDVGTPDSEMKKKKLCGNHMLKFLKCFPWQRVRIQILVMQM